MRPFYKVIIVGAGPAGLCCALNLKKRGISDVLVIEKFVFPRSKCCAGYITNKTKKEYEKLGLDIEKCRYSLIEDFDIFYKCKKRQSIENKFLFTNEKIDREELDYAFFRLAKDAGVGTAENEKVIGHNGAEKTVTLSGGETVGYETLVFADGASGFGSRYVKAKRRNIAMQIITETGLPDGIQIHFGITKRGYGWRSTKNGLTNIGLTDVYRPDVNYRDVFSGYLKKLGINADLSDLKAAFAPIGVNKPVMFDESVFFVGDALGACDPLTLSGLRYGLKSGELAAEAICRSEPRIFEKYAKNLKNKFRFMSLMQRVFYLRSTLFCVFCIGCRLFRPLISSAFNNFFVNKK